jgi:major membrane immunogen (membrane-anchored lipoprotein)
MKKTLMLMAVAALLVACGEKPQTMGGAKQDAAPYTGTGKPFVDAGWKQGDKASWEAHLKARGQNSQNDYSKSN